MPEVSHLLVPMLASNVLRRVASSELELASAEASTNLLLYLMTFSTCNYQRTHIALAALVCLHNVYMKGLSLALAFLWFRHNCSWCNAKVFYWMRQTDACTVPWDICEQAELSPGLNCQMSTQEVPDGNLVDSISFCKKCLCLVQQVWMFGLHQTWVIWILHANRNSSIVRQSCIQEGPNWYYNLFAPTWRTWRISYKLLGDLTEISNTSPNVELSVAGLL